jgi:hypothetical protein
MPELTRRQAVGIAALVAVVAFALALRNGWAGDDLVAVRDNLAAHSFGAALRAWFEPYWPEQIRYAGLYRPFTILTYGLDWTLSGGHAWWFHLTNVLLHAGATALVVLVALAWLAPFGAAAAGVVFAVHPVHVEAVANVVGRAELLVAIGIGAAVLAARRYRRRSGNRRAGWLLAVLGGVGLALLSKEHGVIAIALIALDHHFDPNRSTRDSTPLYLAVAGLTIAWLFLWRNIAGAYVGSGAHAAFFGLSTSERVATMLPVFLEVLRLLAWPFRLTSDYAPQVIPVRATIGALTVLGLAATGALLALGVLLRHRVPVVAFGILVAAVSYLPTSNLVFESGVMLAERNLYLAVLAPALVVGWAVSWASRTPYRRLVHLAAVGFVVACGYRAVERIPFWTDWITPLAVEQTAHPENAHTRLLLSDYFADRADSARALAEVLVAGALFPADPNGALLAAQHATAQGRHRLALREARRAFGLHPVDPRVVDALVTAELQAGLPDSAVRNATVAADRVPNDPRVLAGYGRAMEAAGAAQWQLDLVRARIAWLTGAVLEASRLLGSVATQLPDDVSAGAGCAEVRRTIGVIRALRPELEREVTGPGGCAIEPITR